MALVPGTRIGPYEVIAAIGAGGMGEVYRAHDTKLGRDVALKILPASLAGDPERLGRFRREAQVLAALNHPNIAHIHGFEDSPSASSGQVIHALVMELVEGPTLAGRIAAGPMSITDAVPIARQIAEAMEAAHEQGIVHRDLKPANIKVRDDGTVKVLDFGLAKAMTGDSPGGSSDVMDSPTLTARATQMGVILGTAAYMSPEQAKGRQVDRRTDIWAFGVIVFEMLSGRRGYDAEDVSETLAAVLTREVDWAALPKSTPPRLLALLRDCLARDPKQRLRDIGEARRVLDQMAGGPGSGSASAVSAPPPAPSSRLPWIIAAAAIVLAAVVSAIALQPRAALAVNVVRTSTLLKEFSAFLSITADATKVTYTVARGSTPQIAVRHLDQFDPKFIQGTDGGAWPIFSPDGQWIAFGEIAGPTLRKIPVSGGTSTKIGEGTFSNGAVWGPDEYIVFSSAKGLVKIAAAGGPETAVTTVNSEKNETSHRRPQYLPGGKHLLFTIQMKGDAPPQFAILDLAAGTHRTVAPGGINGRYVSTGHLTYVRAGTLFAVPFDLASQTVTGSEVPVVESISQVGPEGTGDYAIADTGTLVYFSTPTNDLGTTLAWADQTGKTTLLPGQPTRQWGTGRLSPSGRLLANSIDDTKGVRDIWILDVERGTTTRVTFGGGNSDYPVWTRNSQHIYFSSDAGGKPGIYRAPVDGSGKPELVLETPAVPDGVSSVSPDSRHVLYTLSEKGPPRIMLAELDAKGMASNPKPLHDAGSPEDDAEISPDGKWVAYVSLESGNAEVYVHAFPTAGARVRVSTNGGLWPRWSRDGRELYYFEGIPATRLMSVAIPADGGMRLPAPKLVFTLFVGTTFDTTSSKDRFLIELSTRAGGTQIAIVANWFEELKQKAQPKK